MHQSAFAEASAALTDSRPPIPPSLLPRDSDASRPFEPSKSYASASGDRLLDRLRAEVAAKPPLLPPSRLKPTSPIKALPANGKRVRAYSVPSSDSEDEHGSTSSSSSAPDAVDDEPYSPTKDVDDTVWSAPKHPKSPKKRRLEAPASESRPCKTAQSEEHILRKARRQTEPNLPSGSQRDVPKPSRHLRLATDETRTSSHDSGTAKVQRKLPKQTGPSASIPQTSNGRDKRAEASSSHRHSRVIEREMSPDLVVASSRAPGSADSRHAKPRQYNGSERLQLPVSQKKRKSHIKDWVNDVAESVHGDSSPAQHAVPFHDRTLASIESFPKRVLATFHRLGYERIGDLTSRGVLKSDYSALIRHLMTIPPEASAVGDQGSFDEIEAWVAERRLMEL